LAVVSDQKGKEMEKIKIVQNPTFERHDCWDLLGNFVAKIKKNAISSNNSEWVLMQEEKYHLDEQSVTAIGKKLRELNRQLAGAGPAPMMIFISGKYTGYDDADTEANIAYAEKFAVAVWNLGHVAVCPQLNSAMFDYKPEFKPTYDQVCAGYIALMKRCDAVLFIPNWRESRGARNERLEAEQDGMVIFEAVEEIPLLKEAVSCQLSVVRRET